MPLYSALLYQIIYYFAILLWELPLADLTRQEAAH
jgi:hypothetical protein